MNATEFSQLLIELDACDPAKEWAEGKDFKTVWETCDRGDWMEWLAFEMLNKPGWCDLKNLTAAKVKCARLVQHLMKDQRSITALDVAEKFSRGEATLEEMDAAAINAYSAYAAADADADACYAAAAAYTAAAADLAAATKKNTLKQCADICREVIITPLNIHKQTT